MNKKKKYNTDNRENNSRCIHSMKKCIYYTQF